MIQLNKNNILFVMLFVLNHFEMFITQAPPTKVTTSNVTQTKITENKSSNVTQNISHSLKSANSTSGKNCFLGTVMQVTEILSQRIAHYSELCSLNDRKDIKNLIEQAKVLGQLEGKFVSGKIKKLTPDDIKSATKLSVGELINEQIKETSILTQKYFDGLFKIMLEFLNAFADKNDFPTFFRGNIARLVGFARQLEILKEAYPDASQCIPLKINQINTLDLLVNDPSDKENDITSQCDKTIADSIIIDPIDFEVSGMALAFWIVTDGTKLKAKVPVLQGYMKNNKELELSIEPNEIVGSGTVKFTFMNETFSYDIIAKCTEVSFVILSIEKSCDHYLLTLSIRSALSQQRHVIHMNATAPEIENLKINLNKPPVVEPHSFRNFMYSPKEELKVLASMSKGTFSLMLPILDVCGQQSNCIFFSSQDKKCNKCQKGLFLYKGNCVEKCPAKTFNNIDKCDDCSKDCSECKSEKTCDKCEANTFSLTSKNTTTCFDKCPEGFYADEKYETCNPCSNNCVDCKSNSQCVECEVPYFIKNGNCVKNCGDGFWPEYTPRSCKSCFEGCELCTALDKCTNCKEGYFMKNGVCVKNCGENYFEDKIFKKCSPCLDNCKVCGNAKECSKCIDGFKLNQNKKCISDCELGEIEFNGVCVPCADKYCDVCDSKNLQYCNKCDKDYLVQEGNCVETCKSGFYANSKECLPCSRNCKTCDKDKCLLCQEGYFLFKENQCVSECPDGHIPSGKTCIACKDAKCRKCSDKNLDVCTHCYLPEKLKEGKCDKECGPGYFEKNNICEKCIINCNVCKNNLSCDKCADGYFMKEGSCVKECQQGFRENKNGNCERCQINNCNECKNDAHECTKCSCDKVLYGNECLDKCPVGTFLGKDLTCHDCSKGCASCEDETSCINCKAPYVLQGKRCELTCDSGYIVIDGKCKQCKNTNCKRCDSSLSSCVECDDTQFLYNRNCESHCPVGTYKDGKQCSPCVKPCYSCTSNSTCNECIDGYSLLKNKTCTDECPDGSVKIPKNRTCVECEDVGCLKCLATDNTQCIKCNKTMALLKGDCYNICPVGFYNKNGECVNCQKGCDFCTSTTDCTKCSKGMLLKIDKTCVENCGDGFIEKDDTCVKCNGNCLTCKLDNTKYCTKCPNGMLLADGNCINDCPEKYYEDKRECKPCLIQQCAKCSLGGKVCNKCVNGFLLDEESDQCIPAPCPDGKVEINGKCEKCEVANCKKCPANNKKTCVECKEDNNLVNSYTCEKNCPLGTYPAIENNIRKCPSCKENCVECDSAKSCKSCKIGLFLENNDCVKDCKEGSRKDSKKCVPCETEHCSTCTQQNCLQCKTPLVLSNNKCVASCPKGEYLDKKYQTCEKCGLFCDVCKNFETCETCTSPYTLVKGECVDSCPEGSVKVNKQCEKCKTELNCKVCNDKDLTACDKCKKGFVLLNKKCVQKCPEGYFEEDEKCNICVPNCKVCKDGKTCEVCNNKFYLNNLLCQEDCGIGFFKQNGKCIPCETTNCESCTSEKCTKCLEGFYKEESSCTKECSPGFYLFNFLECKKCSNNCISCSTEENCKICKTGFYLKNGKCVNDCGEGYAQTDSECVPCNSLCKKCSNENPKVCEDCKSPNLLKNGECVSSCGAEFFEKSSKCEPCNSNCNVCKNNESCEKCKSNYFYDSISKKCVSECNDGFMADKNKGICSPCEVKDCKKCNSSDKICDECDTDKFKLENKCVPKCDTENGYYIDVGKKECKKCNVECETCKSEKECKKCKKGFVLKDNRCVNNCEEGEILINNECKTCNTETKDCAVCTENLKECLKCKGKKLLMERKIMLQTTKSKETGKGIKSTVSTEIEIERVCVDQCDSGFYPIDGKCQPCNNELCSKCSNSKRCDECVKGYLLQDDFCVAVCESGFVERNGKCVACKDKYCLICNNLTLDTCKKCLLPYNLKDGTCVKECGKGYFEIKIDDMVICSKCNDNCDKCSNEKSCQECSNGFFMKNGKCVDKCGENYIRKNNNCVQCTQPECNQCCPHNPDICLECKSPMYLSDKSTCVSTCGDHYFNRQLPVRTCVKCTDENCVQCSPENTCQRCVKGLFTLNGKCVNACPDGYYSDSNEVCKPCDQSECKHCLSKNPDSCEECKIGFFLYEKQCTKKCPEGTFSDKVNECHKCAENCQECSSFTNCHKCIKPFFLDNDGICTDKCKPGSVDQKGICKKCTQEKECLKCDPNNLGKCYDCEENYVLYNEKCLPSCPKGTFLNGRVCEDCESNCEKCSDATTCLECNMGYIETNADCVDQCRDGWTNVNGHCKECKDSSRCNSCKSDLVTCIKCRTPYLLSEGKCIETCLSGFFYNSTITKCDECTQSCENCDNHVTCKKCFTPKALMPNGTCIEHCPDHYYLDMKTQSCRLCENPNCLKCDTGDSHKCIECPPKEYMIEIEALKSVDCVTICPEGYYKSDKDMKCYKCPQECKSCTNEKNCNACVSPLKLSNNACVNTCPSGYSSRDSVCYKCVDDNCDTCDSIDLNKCLKCNKGILWHGLCISECPASHYLNAKTSSCDPCDSNCAKCNENGCTKCDDKFYFKKSSLECITCNKPNVVVGDSCVNCESKGCVECEPENPNSCRVCDTKLVKHENQCLTECPSGMYKLDGSCFPCGDHCNHCTGKDKCTQCAGFYFLLEGSCLPTCPDHFSPNDKRVCTKCVDSECLNCDETQKICKKCEQDRIVFNGQCVKDCPQGYFMKENTCEKCSENCDVCDENRCIQCKPELKIKGRECKKDCGSGFFDDGKNCTPCTDTNCIKCSPQNICSECNESTFLFTPDAKCKFNCADGYYQNKKNHKCEQCDKGCDKCTELGKCFSCQTGFYLYQGECVKNCPVKTTPLKGLCEKCVQPTCLECIPENPDKCSKCQDTNPLYRESCQNQCPNSTFKKNDICVNCNEKCLECDNEKICKKCKEEFILHNGECLNNCPEGKVLINGVCISCGSDKCKTCSTDVNNCLECVHPFKRFENTCISECPNGYYNEKGICQKCNIGCNTCSDNLSCINCLSGFFYNNDKKLCLTHCESGSYGDCMDHVCKKCDTSCHDCVGPNNTDCVDCSKNYFKNEKECVLPNNCRKGTYPNPLNGECSLCKISFCEDCQDEKTCKKCMKGFTLKSNTCEIGKTSVNIIKNIQIFDEYTYKNKRSTNELFPISKLGGIGIGASVFTLTFWVRKLAPDSITKSTNIFSIRNYSNHAYSHHFSIDHTTGKCQFETTGENSNQVNRIDVPNCSYHDLYDWTFFYITISRKNKILFVTVNYLKNKSFSDYNGQIELSGVIDEILDKEASIEFNNNLIRDAFELYDFNIMDFNPGQEDLKVIMSNLPQNCDFFCSTCKVTCEKCLDGFPINGYCPAHEIKVNWGIKLLDSKQSEVKYVIKDNNVTPFVSDRYGFSTWFFIDDNQKGSDINLYSDNYLSTTEIGLTRNNEVWIRNGALIVNNNKITFGNETYTIETQKWYYLFVGFTEKMYNVTLQNLNDAKEYKTNVINTNEFVRIWDNYEFHFKTNSGSLFNTVIYLNNLPEKTQLLISIGLMKCPTNCNKCGRGITCDSCYKGYNLGTDGKCYEEGLDKVTTLLQRLDLWNDESIDLNISEILSRPEFSFSIWLRKKIPSIAPKNNNNEHTLLGYRDVDGNVVPLIKQTIKSDFVSDISFHWGFTSEQPASFSHTFINEIFDYIHVVLVYNKAQGVLTFDSEDFSIKKTLRIANKNINNTLKNKEFRWATLVVGDSHGEEINMEVSLIDMYRKALTQTDITKIRSTKPIDCDPACIKGCNYQTGKCSECANGSKDLQTCPVFLLGYNVSYTYTARNPSYSSIEDATAYQNLLSKYGFQVGVNSLNYSMFGYAQILDYSSLPSNKTKLRIFTLGNKGIENNNDSDSRKVTVSLDIIEKGLEFTLNSVKQTSIVKVENFKAEVGNWFTFHFGVNVQGKRFNYNILDLKNTAQPIPYKGSGSFQEIPQKLQEIGGITILGVPDHLDTTQYTIPSIRLEHIYFTPNAGYNEELFGKYLKKFTIMADPVCPETCSKCINNIRGQNECLLCKPGYTFSSSECVVKTNNNKYGYMVFTDNIVVTPSTFQIKYLDLLQSDYTISFFIRKNYNTGKPNMVFTSGALRGLIFPGPTKDLFTIKVDKASLTIELEMDEENVWHAITIAVSKSAIFGSIQSHKQKKDNKKPATITKPLDQTLVLPSTILLQMEREAEVQFYGLHLITGRMDEPIVAWPALDCSIDCNYCDKNICRSCIYGRNTNGSCKNSKILFPSENAIPSRGGAAMKLSSFIPKDRPYRSNTYTIEFVAEVLEDGKHTLLKLNNLDTIEYLSPLAASPENHIFVTYDTKDFKFVIGYSNKLTCSDLSTQFVELTYPNKPIRREHYISLSVNKNSILYMIINTEDIIISGELKLKGNMDYLTVNTNMYFFVSKPVKGNDKVSGVLKDIKFNYEAVFSLEEMRKLAVLSDRIVQKACIAGSSTVCDQCKAGFLVSNLCSPDPDAVVYSNNNIINVSRWSKASDTFKYAFKTNIDLREFTFSFWFRITAFVLTNQGIARLSVVNPEKSSNPNKTINLLSIVFSPKNELMIQYMTGKDAQVITMIGLLKSDEIFSWQHATISVSYTSGKISVSIFCVTSQRHFSREELFDNSFKLTVSQKTALYTAIGFSDTVLATSDNVSYEIATIIFTPNNSFDEKLETEYTTMLPKRCRNPCKDQCINEICPEDKRLTTSLDIGNIFAGSAIKTITDVKDYANLPLFRPLLYETGFSQSFTKYLISFELDVNKFLSSKYIANKDILLIIHNENREEYDSLSMNDLIPNSLERTGAFSIVHKSGAIFLNSGYVPWSTSTQSNAIPLGGRKINDYQKLYFIMYVDIYGKTIHMVVISDDVGYSDEIGTISFTSPISYFSLVYNHPSIDKIKLNLHNPRFDVDVRENALNLINADFPTNYCNGADKDCKSCHVLSQTQQSFCLKCNSGFQFFNGACNKEYMPLK